MKLSRCNVRFGSNSEAGTRNRDVRFTPGTGLSIASGALPKRAQERSSRALQEVRHPRKVPLDFDFPARHRAVVGRKQLPGLRRDLNLTRHTVGLHPACNVHGVTPYLSALRAARTACREPALEGGDPRRMRTEVADILKKENATLWINHDKAQRDGQKLSPEFYN